MGADTAAGAVVLHRRFGMLVVAHSFFRAGRQAKCLGLDERGPGPSLEAEAAVAAPAPAAEVQIDFVLVASKDAEEAPTEFSIVTTSAALAISASELRAELRDFPRR